MSSNTVVGEAKVIANDTKPSNGSGIFKGFTNFFSSNPFGSKKTEVSANKLEEAIAASKQATEASNKCTAALKTVTEEQPKQTGGKNKKKKTKTNTKRKKQKKTKTKKSFMWF